MKNQYRGGDCIKKGAGAWTVSQFKGWLGKKEGEVFLRGGGGLTYPNAHYDQLCQKILELV